MGATIINKIKQINFRIPIVIAVILTLVFVPYWLTHASTQVNITINGGPNKGGAYIENLTKGQCANFTLTTNTTTANTLGYTMSAYTRTNNNDITIKKLDNNQDITNTPTTIITTTGPITNDEQDTEYQLCTNSGIADNISIELAYTLAENQPIYLAKVVADNNITTMQTLTTELCQSAAWDDTNNGTNDNNTATLTDTRNSQPYQVRKLADGNCWMVNNLKLGSTSGPTTLTSVDTNLQVASWNLPQVGVSTTNYYDQPIVDGPIPDSSGNYSTATSYDSTDITSEYFGGYLYNWCAATAGMPSASSGNPGYTCTDSSTTPDDAQQDICPANWRLPTGGYGDTDFNKLYNAYRTSYDNDYNKFLFAGPFKGVFSGYRSSSMWFNQGSDGYFWSGSHYSVQSYAAFLLTFYSGSATPFYGDNRNYRFAVRCLLAP